MFMECSLLVKYQLEIYAVSLAHSDSLPNTQFPCNNLMRNVRLRSDERREHSMIPPRPTYLPLCALLINYV